MLKELFEEELVPLVKGENIAVACSGGPDSMALALLASVWAKKRKAGITAITVDHGLREESAAESVQVGKWLKKRGISHVILRWEGRKPRSNLQEAAREARYRLLTDYCRAHGIQTLLVAHTREDQAETFLLRLRRGSGVDGLAAMAKTTLRDGIRILRPLLQTKKAELIAYLKANKQDYIHDPSNENTSFDRVKIRQFLPQLAEIGISVDKLARTAENMARAREYLRQETENFIAGKCQVFPEGYATFTLPGYDELALRVLARLLMRIGCHGVPPRLDELERLYASLRAPGFKSATLGGCIFKKDKPFIVLREPRAVDNPVLITKAGTYIWDRFEITVPKGAEEAKPTPPRSEGISEAKGTMRSPAYKRMHSPPAPRPLSLGALTQEGWLTLSRKHKLKNPYPDKRILYTLPAIRDAEGNILAVPHLGIHYRE